MSKHADRIRQARRRRCQAPGCEIEWCACRISQARFLCVGHWLAAWRADHDAVLLGDLAADLHNTDVHGDLHDERSGEKLRPSAPSGSRAHL
jgi:hypothetical protein